MYRFTNVCSRHNCSSSIEIVECAPFYYKWSLFIFLVFSVLLLMDHPSHHIPNCPLEENAPLCASLPCLPAVIRIRHTAGYHGLLGTMSSGFCRLRLHPLPPGAPHSRASADWLICCRCSPTLVTIHMSFGWGCADTGHSSFDIFHRP